MKIISPSYQCMTHLDEGYILRLLELAGRTCYKSEDSITPESARKFVQMILHQYKHESVIEHFSFTVRFICSRGFSHELVRHRLASFSQESTRYANYSKKKFGSEITLIDPRGSFDMTDAEYASWRTAMMTCEETYMDLIKSGQPAQMARAVLPNSLKTEVVTSANLREWRHILRLRTSKQAHPEMRELMCPLLNELKTKVPILFDDIGE